MVMVALTMLVVWWWGPCGVVVEERVRDEGLRENSEMCVYACVCVHDYISTLNYQIFLIVFTTLTTTTMRRPHHHHHQH